MTDKEKEAIERLKYIDMQYDCNNYYSRYDLDCIETILNLLQTQQAEIEKKDKEILELKKENRELGNQINILTDELHKIYPPMASI